MKEALVTYNNDRDVITNGESWVYTDSLNLAKVLDYPHRRILERIRDVFADYNIKEDGQLKWQSSEITENTEFVNKHTDFTYALSHYKNSQNKLQPYYKLSKDLLILVVFSYRRLPKAQEIQKMYIAKFNEMEKELNWWRARYLGIDVRNGLTDSIKEYLESPKWYDYKNFTDLIYKTIFDKNAKQFRELRDIEPKENIRPHLSKSELKKVEKLEEEISILVSYGLGYKQVRDLISKKYKDDDKKLIA